MKSLSNLQPTLLDHPLQQSASCSSANNLQISQNSEMRTGLSTAVQMSNLETCRVCGDAPARMHYGVVTCFGCKGFFRRTLKRPTEYTCRHQGNCIVDRHERNSCRYCRFKRCLEVGMDPKAVRPDRDTTGRHFEWRSRRHKQQKQSWNSEECKGVGFRDQAIGGGSGGMAGIASLLQRRVNSQFQVVHDEWMRRLPVDLRTTLMQIMNVDLIVSKGDTHENAKIIYPLKSVSLVDVLRDASVLKGKRTEIRYEAYRKVENDELPAVAHRRLIAVIDWINNLFDIMDLKRIRDKLILIRNAYAPLTIFSFCVQTATVLNYINNNKNAINGDSNSDNVNADNIMCLCNFGYVPRNASEVFEEPYHLSNRLIERAFDELVEPFRNMNFNDHEIALFEAIIILNPYLKKLSEEAQEQISEMRDRLQETFYHVVRETHPKQIASARFGNILLFLPNITILGELMRENIESIAKSAGTERFGDHLMLELLDNNHKIYNLNDNINSDNNNSNSIVTNGNNNKYNKNTIKNSSSSSSISSLASSHTSSSSFDFDFNGHFNIALPDHQNYNALESSGKDSQQAANDESDAAYNLTITPNMTSFQEITSALNLDDNLLLLHTTPPNSPEFGYTPVPTPFQRAHFFIDEMKHAVERTDQSCKMEHRNKFVVMKENAVSLSHTEEQQQKSTICENFCPYTESEDCMEEGAVAEDHSRNMPQNESQGDDDNVIGQSEFIASADGIRNDLDETMEFY